MLSQEATRRGLTLEVFKGPALLAVGDGEALRQVLFNLVGNALKFTAHGSVRVELSVESGRLRVSVRDVEATGQVAGLRVLADTTRVSRGAEADHQQLIKLITRAARGLRFPKQRGRSRVTLPMVFERS